MTRGQLYVNLTGGQNFNVADLINTLNGNNNNSLSRINIVCNTLNGLPTNILLPEISTLGGFTNLEITVTDSTNNAAAGNIIITRGGTLDRINATTNFTINTNSGKAYFIINSVKNGTIAASWSSFSTTQTATPYVPPTQVNEVITAGVAPTGVQLAHFPVLSSQHVIVGINHGIANVGLEYTINYATGFISIPTISEGQVVNVFYSY